MSQDCLKRIFSEVYSSSSSSSSICLGKEWNELYTTKFLELLEAEIVRPRIFGKKMVYWKEFTKELNKLIKAEEPQFVGFEPMVVLKHGKKLRSLYHISKNIGCVLSNFALYEKCFKKCDTCTEKPPKCNTCRNTPTFSFSYASRSLNDSSQENSSNHSSRKRKTTSGDRLADRIAKRLAYFAEGRHSSFTTINKASKYFSESPRSARVWLFMSPDTQIAYLQDILP